MTKTNTLERMPRTATSEAKLTSLTTREETSESLEQFCSRVTHVEQMLVNDARTKPLQRPMTRQRIADLD